jgi:transcriptional regulator with XRE-family HTH domain
MEVRDQAWARGQGALRDLGERLAARRLERNQTQAQLAREAGVALRTIVRLERGESTQLANFVRVLRALELLEPLLESLARLAPEPASRPLAQLRRRARERRRASSPRTTPEQEGASGWTWGDEAGGGAR